MVEEMYPNCSLFARFRHERPFQQAKNKLNRKLVRVVFLNLRFLKRAVFVQHRGKYIRNRRLAFACFGTRLKGKLDNHPCCANTQIFKIVPLLTLPVCLSRIKRKYWKIRDVGKEKADCLFYFFFFLSSPP